MMRFIVETCGALALVTLVGCQRPAGHDSVYYLEAQPGVETVRGVPEKCSVGSSVSFRTNPEGPVFHLLPVPVGSPARNELNLGVELPADGGPRQGGVLVKCQSASLIASGRQHPPRSSDGSQATKSCGESQHLAAPDAAGHSVQLVFAAKEELPERLTLRLPEVQYPGRGLVLPPLEVTVRRVDIRKCSSAEVGGGWH